MSKVVTALNSALADSYVLYLKTQNFHWNVVGPSFKALHSLFQEQYEDLSVAIDTIAERIRAINAPAIGTMAEFLQITSINEVSGVPTAAEMIQALAVDQITLKATLTKGIEAAAEVNDEATQDMLIARISQHEKNAWMLNSSL